MLILSAIVQITGDVWEVSATNDKSKKNFLVGVIMFEGATGGLQRLGTFDEMLGKIFLNLPVIGGRNTTI